MDTDRMTSAREQARAFAEREIAGSVGARDREARWDPALFSRMGEAGLLGALFPREHGGGAWSAIEFAQAMIGLGEGSGDGGLALAWAAHTLGCGVPIWLEGHVEQRRRHLPGLCSGATLGAWAHGERGVAGDPVGVQTRATRQAGGWLLAGRKTWVVNAPHADLFVVTALTDPARGRGGVSAFVVERDAPGLFVEPRIETAGVRTVGIAELVLDGCAVPEDSLLGAEGEGLRAWRAVQRWERGCLLAPWLGLARAALAQAVAHARAHVQFGASLADSQSARARLADMKIRLDLCERLQLRAAWQLEGGDRHAERDLVVARLFAGESLAWIAGEAARLCAPLRFEHALERLSRDARFAGLLGVGDDVLRSILAGAMLGLG